MHKKYHTVGPVPASIPKSVEKRKKKTPLTNKYMTSPFPGSLQALNQSGGAKPVLKGTNLSS